MEVPAVVDVPAAVIVVVIIIVLVIDVVVAAIVIVVAAIVIVVAAAVAVVAVAATAPVNFVPKSKPFPFPSQSRLDHQIAENRARVGQSLEEKLAARRQRRRQRQTEEKERAELQNKTNGNK